MSIRFSSRAPLVALVSFVLALGMTVGPSEGEAFAQRARPKTQRPNKKDKGKDRARERAKKDAEPAATEEDKRKAEEQPSSADPKTDPKTDPKAAPPVEPTAEEEKKTDDAAPQEEKKELDTSVESSKAVYISGDIAFTRSDLGAISDNTGFDRTVANGALFGLSTGVRLKDLRLGVRWRVYDTTEFALWTFALSAGYGLPLRPVSPVFSAHVGYVFDQSIESGLFRKSLPPGNVLPPDVDVKGLIAGVDVNASYWMTKFLRLGAFIGADLMFLGRERAAVPQSIYGPPAETPSHPLYSGSGSGIGLNMNLGLRGAFDIGFQ